MYFNRVNIKSQGASRIKPNKNENFMIGGQASGSLSYGKKYGSKQTVQKPFSPGADLEADQNSMEPVEFGEFENQNSKRGATT